jgi:hypothetical protein
VAGLAHAFGILRARWRRGARATAPGARSVHASTAYAAAWTVALWMLFGTYVLTLWAVAALVYAAKLIRDASTRRA